MKQYIAQIMPVIIHLKRNVLFATETYFSFTSVYECVEQLHFLKSLKNLNRNVPLLLDEIDD